LKEISTTRMEQYSLLADAYSSANPIDQFQNLPPTAVFSHQQKLAAVFDVMALFKNRHPSEHIRIDLESGQINRLN
ncbi:MAG: hypothetical protein RI513_04330, partial [Balneolaceae bacterium]|nr:hypothetical protein [Balneolaceae bacterium]